jgi:hypothetical protein
MKSQEDFRKILSTPRTASGTTAPPLLPPHRRTSSSTTTNNPFKKPPPRIRREGRSDVLEHSHVDLGTGFIDRAKERRLAELRGEGESSGEVKGLDFDLLKKVRSGEFVIPKFEVPVARAGEESDSEEEGEVGGEGDGIDEDAILDELLEMEMELRKEQEELEKEKPKDDEKEKVLVEPVVEKEEETEKPVEDPAKIRFKPIVDAKQLKQMRREQKRRRLAMETMDRISKPAPPAPPPKKTRAELLEQLRQIQAAKKQQASMAPPHPPKPIIERLTPQQIQSTPDLSAISSSQSPDQAIKPEPTTKPSISPNPKELEPIEVEPNPEPIARSPPPPPVKVSVNMFSDESELSDYNPYDSYSDSDNETPIKQTKPSQPPAKQNYFGDKETPAEETPSGPVTMDPTIAAALRKVAALTDKRTIPEEVLKEDKKKVLNRMSLGGADGVYEFDEEDTWDAEEEVEEVGKKKRKRK